MHNTMAPWPLRPFLQKSFPTIIVAAVFMLTSMSFVVPAQSQVEIMPSWDYNPVLHHTRIADDKIETNNVAAGDLDGDGAQDLVIPLMTNSRGSRSRPHVDVVTIFNTTPQLLAPPVASFP